MEVTLGDGVDPSEGGAELEEWSLAHRDVPSRELWKPGLSASYLLHSPTWNFMSHHSHLV